MLWELCHVFFDHLPGAGAGTGASSFLYPFLDSAAGDLDAVTADVRASVLAKARGGDGAARPDARRERRASSPPRRTPCAAPGRSWRWATAARRRTRWTPSPTCVRRYRALDLTADAAILTAVANDVGVEAMFARQVIAYGHPGDALVAFTTSGGSANVIAALAEARRRGLATVAFVGYDGGRIAAEGLADHVVVVRSEHIPRIQEAQATAWHVLRERMGE